MGIEITKCDEGLEFTDESGDTVVMEQDVDKTFFGMAYSNNGDPSGQNATEDQVFSGLNFIDALQECLNVLNKKYGKESE